MIYVTVGNHNQPFDRLIAEMDRLAGELEVETLVQAGPSGYRFQNARSWDYSPFQEAEELIKRADVVVGHAGIGTIISARKWKTPLIICPRRKSTGEHINDHQLEICRELAENPRPGVEVAFETEEIKPRLLKFLKKRPNKPLEVESKPALNLKTAIKEYINLVCKSL